MAATELATGYISLAVSTRGLGKDIARQFGGVEKQATKSGRTAGSRLGSGILGGVKGIAAPIAGLLAADKIIKFFGDSLAEAREAQKVGAVTTQVIKATGGAAKISAGQVGILTSQISAKTGIDDEAIQSGANLLLTFKNVRNEVGQGANVFDRATAAAVDLSAAGFGSVESGSKMLGKALNDPVKGITALSRAGVTFTDQQKDQIKTLVASGKTLEAQKIILGEVESQVGGVAAASATASEKLSVSFGNFKEQVGTALVPVIDRVASTLTTRVIPALSSFVTGMTEGTGAGGEFVGFVRGAGAALASFGGFVARNRAVIVPLVSALAAGVVVFKTIAAVTKAYAVAQAALNIVMTANPIGLVVVAVAGLVAGLIYAYKHSETFRQVVNAAFAGVKKVAGTVIVWLGKAVRTVIDYVGKNWKRLLPLLAGPIGLAYVLIRKHWASIKSTFFSVVEAIRKRISDRFGAIRDRIKSTIADARTKASATIRAMRDTFYSVTDAIRKRISDRFTAIRDKIKTTIGSARDGVKTILGAGENGLQSVFTNAVAGIGKIWDGLKKAAKTPIEFIIDTVINKGLIGGFNSLARLVGATELATITDWKPKGWATGGWTGPGAKTQPAGVVHADEFVVRKQSRRKFEKKHPHFLDYINEKGDLPGYWLGGGVQPVPGGANKHSRARYPWARWAGDLPVGQGTPVHAYDAGQVSSVKRWNYSYGNHIRINHGAEQTLYAHLSRIAVTAGAQVARNQVIGNVGSTGNSSGPHLHFELKGGNGKLDTSTDGGDTGGSLFDFVGELGKKFTGPLDRLKELGSSPFAEMVKRVPGMAKDALISKAKSVAGNVLSGVIGKVGNIGKALGVGRQAARLAGLKLGASSVGTYPGHQPSMNKAWDFMATGSTGERIAQHMAKYRKAYNISYLIWNRRIMRDYNKGNIRAGQWAPYFDGNSSNPNRAHTNHVHASFYDNGGVLKPGASLTMNATGKPEAVLTNPQWRAVAALAEKADRDDRAGGNHFYGDFRGPSAKEVADEIERRQRRREALRPVRA